MTDATPPDADGARASEDFVQSLARGLAVIRAFDADHAQLTLSEVARRAEIPRAAARRFLRTLETLGYVRTDAAAATFALTPRVLDLGFSYLSSLTLPELVQPHLERLSREVDESVSASVLDGGDIVYIARVPTRRIMSVRITIGTRFPAFATSMGRVLLADLDEADALARIAASGDRHAPAEAERQLAAVREQGYAIVDGELEPLLVSAAVAVRDRAGRAVAAVNVATSGGPGTAERLAETVVPLLIDAAAAASADLSG
jgi:IclR family pca regulon transcriptional regulator